MKDYNEVKNLIERCNERIEQKRELEERLARQRKEIDKKLKEIDKKLMDKIDATEAQFFNLYNKRAKYMDMTIGQERIEEFVNKLSEILDDEYKKYELNCQTIFLTNFPVRKNINKSIIKLIVHYKRKTDESVSGKLHFESKFDREAVEANDKSLIKFIKTYPISTQFTANGYECGTEIPWEIAKDITINISMLMDIQMDILAIQSNKDPQTVNYSHKTKN